MPIAIPSIQPKVNTQKYPNLYGPLRGFIDNVLQDHEAARARAVAL